METKELIQALRLDAEWAHANEWETPIMLGDHLDAAADALAADVAPVVHGEWLNFTGDFSTAECNQCGELCEVSPDEKPCEDFFSAFKKFYKFCPNCGAKMDAKSEVEK